MNKQEFNPLIHEKLREQNIESGYDENEALLLLLSMYYKLPQLCISETIIKKVNLTKIIERDYEKSSITSDYIVKWNIPLFIEEEKIDDDWEWINTEYRVLFEKVRLDAKGDKSGCTGKMKKYFAKHPSIRKSDVIDAANMYISTFKHSGQNIKFLQRADYFISKNEKGTEMSRLDQYVEQIKKLALQSSGRNSRLNVLTEKHTE